MAWHGPLPPVPCSKLQGVGDGDGDTYIYSGNGNKDKIGGGVYSKIKVFVSHLLGGNSMPCSRVLGLARPPAPLCLVVSCGSTGDGDTYIYSGNGNKEKIGSGVYSKIKVFVSHPLGGRNSNDDITVGDGNTR